MVMVTWHGNGKHDMVMVTWHGYGKHCTYANIMIQYSVKINIGKHDMVMVNMVYMQILWYNTVFLYWIELKIVLLRENVNNNYEPVNMFIP